MLFFFFEHCICLIVENKKTIGTIFADIIKQESKRGGIKMNILFVCAAGMSTSLLVADMKNFAKPGTKINAMAFSELEDVIKEYDVVLVGPQLRFKLNNINKIAEPMNKPVDVIDAEWMERKFMNLQKKFTVKILEVNKWLWILKKLLLQ